MKLSRINAPLMSPYVAFERTGCISSYIKRIESTGKNERKMSFSLRKGENNLGTLVLPTRWGSEDPLKLYHRPFLNEARVEEVSAFDSLVLPQNRREEERK